MDKLERRFAEFIVELLIEQAQREASAPAEDVPKVTGGQPEPRNDDFVADTPDSGAGRLV